jgi:hypothetical protein
LATGSALTFDGTKLSLGATSAVNNLLTLAAPSTVYTPQLAFQHTTNSQAEAFIGSGSNAHNIWITAGAEPTGDPDGSNWATARSTVAAIYRQRNANHIWFTNTGLTASTTFTPTEGMRLTSTGLGIGTSSTANQLTVYRTSSSTANGALRLDGNGNYAGIQFAQSGNLRGSLSVDNTSLYLTHESILAFYTGGTGNVGGTERMRIDSSGNLGLGVTPSAWYTPLSTRALEFYSGSLFNISNTDFGLIQNGYLNSVGSYVYKASLAACRQDLYNGGFRWYTAASGTAGNAISFTQAMTLNASGSLLVGTTSENPGIGNTDNGVKAGGELIAASRASNFAGFFNRNTDDGGTVWFGRQGTQVGSISVSTTGVTLTGTNGITFTASQTASADANTLDDYEEGTWTPVLSRDGTAPTITYTSRPATYVKIGQMVYCMAEIDIGSISANGSGLNQLTGLPFAAETAAGGGGGGRWGAYMYSNNALTSADSFYVISGNTFGYFYNLTNQSNPSANYAVGVLYLTIVYKASA